MNKIFNFFLLFLFISNCSLDTKTGLWTESEKINSEKESVEKKLFNEAEIFEKEFNKDLKIKLKNNFKKNSFINNLSINNGVVKYNGNISKIYKYKFSKISQFDYFQPELLITKKNTLPVSIIFIDPPYYKYDLQKILIELIKEKVIETKTIIIIESHLKEKISIPNEFKIFDKRLYGKTLVYFLKLLT